MIRRKLGAVAAAVVGAMLIGTGAQAATAITLKCVASQARTLKTCVATCRTDFNNNRAACYGPGQQCAQLCQSDPVGGNGNEQCLAPVNAAIAACNGACAATQKSSIDVCRSQFPNDQNQLDMCANQARLVNLDCKLQCTADNDQARLACAQQLGACLAACASCGTPDQCPATN